MNIVNKYMFFLKIQVGISQDTLKFPKRPVLKASYYMDPGLYAS